MNYFVCIIIDACSTVNNENPISSEGVKHWTKSFSHENSLVASTSIRFSVDRRSHPFERVLRCNRSNHRNSPAFDEFPSSFARKCSYVNSFVTDRAWMPRFQDFRSIASTGTHTRAHTHAQRFESRTKNGHTVWTNSEGVSSNIFTPGTMRTIPSNFMRDIFCFPPGPPFF